MVLGGGRGEEGADGGANGQTSFPRRRREKRRAERRAASDAQKVGNHRRSFESFPYVDLNSWLGTL